jgi:hypothetical protein
MIELLEEFLKLLFFPAIKLKRLLQREYAPGACLWLEVFFTGICERIAPEKFKAAIKSVTAFLQKRRAAIVGVPGPVRKVIQRDCSTIAPSRLVSLRLVLSALLPCSAKMSD